MDPFDVGDPHVEWNEENSAKENSAKEESEKDIDYVNLIAATKSRHLSECYIKMFPQDPSVSCTCSDYYDYFPEV